MKKQWCISKITPGFIASMERILWLYSLPYDPEYPLLCFDESPCFLIEQTQEPIPMRCGDVVKENYKYKKNGSCALLACIEPLEGTRIAKVYGQRTAKEYTDFMQRLAEAYPQAKKIRLIQDNLNTHQPSSFYKYLPADQAFELEQKFEWNYTPKSASWLNMIEIEFSALTKQCLGRRIPNQQELEKQIMAIIKERNDSKIKIEWQFSQSDARDKLNRHYSKVNQENEKFRSKK